jgi:DNA invertase Pin-like site-specific DNA recombinase
MIVGYARVSTDGQSLEAQHSALTAAGAERVFSEKVSGTVTDRKALGRAIAALDAGDVLLVTRLDRLARSTRDLLNVLDEVSKAGAGFRSLSDQWADTTTPHGRLMLTVLGGLAEFERSLILARTAEGRTRAKARGVKFGRKPSLTAHQQAEALARRAAGEPCVDSARSYAVSQSTISRLALWRLRSLRLIGRCASVTAQMILSSGLGLPIAEAIFCAHTYFAAVSRHAQLRCEAQASLHWMNHP